MGESSYGRTGDLLALEQETSSLEALHQTHLDWKLVPLQVHLQDCILALCSVAVFATENEAPAICALLDVLNGRALRRDSKDAEVGAVGLGGRKEGQDASELLICRARCFDSTASREEAHLDCDSNCKPLSRASPCWHAVQPAAKSVLDCQANAVNQFELVRMHHSRHLDSKRPLPEPTSRSQTVHPFGVHVMHPYDIATIDTSQHSRAPDSHIDLGLQVFVVYVGTARTLHC